MHPRPHRVRVHLVAFVGQVLADLRWGVSARAEQPCAADDAVRVPDHVIRGAALIAHAPDTPAIHDEEARAQVLTGLLREVDPLLVIDGIDISDEDEHNPERAA